MTISQANGLLVGSQQPRLLLEPKHRASSAGQEAVELAAQAGLHLDPWQQLALDIGCAETADGQWSAFEVGIVVGRQNGKNGILEARELAGLFLFGEELIIHSAHQYQTSKEAFYRMRALIEGCPDLLKKVQQFYASSLEFSVKLKTGQRLRYLARSSGGGRGFSGDLVVLDEAFQLGPTEMGALLPTLSSKPNPQVWYTSSAPMSSSQQLHAVRRRAITGTDEALAYMEWSAPEGADPRSPESWALANPALGYRISLDYVTKELDALPMSEFGRERLGFPDPEPRGPGEGMIPMPAWFAALDPKSKIEGRVVLAADVNPSRTWGSLAVAGRRPDGDWHVEVVARRKGTQWMVDEIVRLRARHDIGNPVIDPTGPAGSLIRPLQDAGVEVDQVNARGHAQSCGLLFDMVTATGPGDVPRPLVHHLGQSELSDALASAEKRDLGDAWAWRRGDDGADISPLVAATLALGAAVGLADVVADAPVFAY